MGFFDEQQIIPTPPEGRVEAIFKVTGKGKYSAEYELDNLCYGVFVCSTIAAGTIKAINTGSAYQVQGVHNIITHYNKEVVPGFATEDKIKKSGFGLGLFHTDTIYFKGQPIALVIAETLEDATYAASLVEAEYNVGKFEVDFDTARTTVTLKATDKERGKTDNWSSAPFVVEKEYSIKHEVHNPMEMHATIAHWTGDGKLKLYDKNQGVNSVQKSIGKLFNLVPDNINVISEYVGGGFGSGLRVWANTIAAVMASRLMKRPVKVVLTRPQMFTMVGYRPQSWQKIKLGAGNDGKFTGIIHQAKNATSLYENFSEGGITRISRLIYNFENLKTESATVPVNLSTPTWMRAPGDCTGDFAVESAIDELSYLLKQDPVELRLRNLSLEKDPESGKPWSTNFINECIKIGAAKINWDKRPTLPGQLSDGDWKTGYGMAVGMWNAGRRQSSATILMQVDGTITIQTAMTDIGTGTGTAMQNIAAEHTGLPKKFIKIELGNSDFAPAPSQGGSTGLSSLSGALVAVSQALKAKLAGFAALQNESYKNALPEDILLAENGISLKTNNNQFISYASIWKNNSLDILKIESSSAPGDERNKYAFCSAAAHFCVLKVNTKTGKIKIEKMVAVVDGGKIINEKAAANQVSGAAVGGIGMALMEQQTVDAKLGSLISADLAGYHFAVNADAPIIDVLFIDKPDFNSNPTGSKGLGEVGIIGSAAAIANAIYNATGKRFRDLPITPDKILMG